MICVWEAHQINFAGKWSVCLWVYFLMFWTINGTTDLSCVTFYGGAQWQTKETISLKSHQGTDEFMGFLGGVWETRRKGSSITKKIYSQHGWPKDWVPGAPCATCRQLNWRVFSPSRFFFTSSLNPGRSHMNDVKFLELPESYKFPVSFPCLLAPVPSLYKRRFHFRGNSYIMLLGWRGDWVGRFQASESV